MFSQFGSVISTRILRDPNGMSRGVGFCRMESKEKCEQIIKAYHGQVLPGTGKCILMMMMTVMVVVMMMGIEYLDVLTKM